MSGLDERLKVIYTNWQGLKSLRRITPVEIFFGCNEWHPEPQWLMKVFDEDKREYKIFSFDGLGIGIPEEKA